MVSNDNWRTNIFARQVSKNHLPGPMFLSKNEALPAIFVSTRVSPPCRRRLATHAQEIDHTIYHTVNYRTAGSTSRPPAAVLSIRLIGACSDHFSERKYLPHPGKGAGKMLPPKTGIDPKRKQAR